MYLLKVKFLSYFDFSKILFTHTLYFPPPSFVYVRGFVDTEQDPPRYYRIAILWLRHTSG